MLRLVKTVSFPLGVPQQKKYFVQLFLKRLLLNKGKGILLCSRNFLKIYKRLHILFLHIITSILLFRCYFKGYFRNLNWKGSYQNIKKCAEIYF